MVSRFLVTYCISVNERVVLGSFLFFNFFFSWGSADSRLAILWKPEPDRRERCAYTILIQRMRPRKCFSQAKLR